MFAVRHQPGTAGLLRTAPISNPSALLLRMRLPARAAARAATTALAAAAAAARGAAAGRTARRRRFIRLQASSRQEPRSDDDGGGDGSRRLAAASSAPPGFAPAGKEGPSTDLGVIYDRFMVVSTMRLRRLSRDAHRRLSCAASSSPSSQLPAPQTSPHPPPAPLTRPTSPAGPAVLARDPLGPLEAGGRRGAHAGGHGRQVRAPGRAVGDGRQLP
jgi:hypothetical protein